MVYETTYKLSFHVLLGKERRSWPSSDVALAEAVYYLDGTQYGASTSVALPYL